MDSGPKAEVEHLHKQIKKAVANLFTTQQNIRDYVTQVKDGKKNELLRGKNVYSVFSKRIDDYSKVVPDKLKTPLRSAADTMADVLNIAKTRKEKFKDFRNEMKNGVTQEQSDLKVLLKKNEMESVELATLIDNTANQVQITTHLEFLILYQNITFFFSTAKQLNLSQCRFLVCKQGSRKNSTYITFRRSVYFSVESL